MIVCEDSAICSEQTSTPMDRLTNTNADHNMASSSEFNSTSSSESFSSSSFSSSGSFLLKIFFLIVVLLALCAHQVSSLPGASIGSDRDSNDVKMSDKEFDVVDVWKRDTMCQRGTEEEDKKWDHCERCARTTRHRDTFKLCCSGAAYRYCTELLEYRPEEFNKRPRARRAPVNFNRLLRSALSHNMKSHVW